MPSRGLRSPVLYVLVFAATGLSEDIHHGGGLERMRRAYWTAHNGRFIETKNKVRRMYYLFLMMN